LNFIMNIYQILKL